jgi:hypothetical protein
MATNGEKPAKKGTKDPLLEELKVVASKTNPPAEVPPRDTDKADSGISAESIRSEREVDALIDKNIETRRAAEAVATPEVSPAVPATPPAETTEQKVIPPELEHLDEGERELYLKLPKTKQESYLAHITEVRADKEKKEKASKNKKPVKHRTQNPKAQASEKIKEMTRRMKEETAEELKQMTTARAAALKPSGAAPDAPTIKLSVDVARSEAAGKPNQDKDHPAVFRHNRDGWRTDWGKTEVQVEPPLSGPELPPTETWQSPKSEGTLAENKSRLKSTVDSLMKKMELAKEKFDWYKSSNEGLIRRSEDLTAQLEKVGGVEKGFRWLGEKYNKLGWKSKLAVGASLGLGAVFTAGTGAIAIPLALIAGQRIAGLSTMYLKFEKNLHEEKWGKEKAMLKAGVYTVLMGVAMKEAIEYASGTAPAHWAQEKVEGWLGTMLGHKEPPSKLPDWVNMPKHAPSGVSHLPVESSAVATAANEGISAAAPTPDVSHAAAAAAAGAHEVAAAAKVEMPTVGASSHGYEGMLKDLIKQLPDKPPVGMKEGSDLAKLFEAKANPESIGTAIHKLAMDHKFFTDQGSFRIDTSAHMSVDPHGNILFNGEVQAPAGVHFTPALSAEAPAPHIAPPVETVVAQPISVAPEVVTPPPGAEAYAPPHQPPPIAPPVEHAPVHEPVIESSEIPFVSPPEAPVVPAEMPPTPAPEVQPFQSETIVSPDTTVTTMNAPESVSEPHVEIPPMHAAETIAAQPPAPVIEHGFVSNSFGLQIPIGEPHIYADEAKHLFIYGGSASERAVKILEYLKEHTDSIVYGSDRLGNGRIPYYLNESGELAAGDAVRKSFLERLFSADHWMGAPGPKEFAEKIK